MDKNVKNEDHIVFGRPVIVLEKEKFSLERKQGGKEIRTRSSNNSASPLYLFTNPLKLDFPNVTRGLNFDDNMLSRNAMRGYTIGIPVSTLSPSEKEGDKRRNVTELYDDMLDTLW